MTRTRASFKITDAKRLIEAAKACGVNVAGLELQPDGTLRVLEKVSLHQNVSEFDRWEKEL